MGKTLWQIPDSPATRQFIGDFFEAIEGQGMSKTRALSHARRLAKERHAPAQVWSAWVLVGSPE